MDAAVLGETGLVGSRVGIGLAALGRPGYINIGHAADLGETYDVEAMEAHAHAVLDLARASGVRYFDAARSYGKAEAFLASWLTSRRIAPGEVVVGSKWGYTYTADWKASAETHEVKEHSLATLRRQAEETRATLGDFVNLYQIHSATLESGVLGNRAVLDQLAALRDSEGWAIGLSLTGPKQGETLRKAMEIEINGRRLFDCAQATWNLLEPSAGPALKEARDHGLGVIVKEALANGRLTSRNDDPAFATSRQALEVAAASLGATVDALAIAAVLAQPWADVVLSGAADEAQLRSNLAATDLKWNEATAQALAAIAESPDDYWSIRSRLPWN